MVSRLRKVGERFKKLQLGDYFIRRNPVFYPRARRRLARLVEGDFETRQAWTEARLKTVLSIAKRTGYGRQVGGGEDLVSWPLLEKERLRDNQAMFIARRDWLTATAATGGTTGLPLQLARSPESVAVEQSFIDYVIRHLNADPRQIRIAVLRGDNIKAPSDLKPPYWRYSHGGRRMLLSSNMLMAATLPDYVQALKDFKPDLLWAYPTSLEALCRLLMKAGQRLEIPRVLTSSEVLKREAWRLAIEILGCSMADYYGQAERLAFAWATRSRDYRFLPGYGHIELIPFDAGTDAAAEDDGKLYEIVGTSLWNLAMPLVRYKTGDLIRLPSDWGEREREELCLGLRAFKGVLGREQEILVCPRGVRLTGIDHIPRDVKHILRIQVIQENLHRVRILVLPSKGFTEDDSQQLLQNARAKVPETMELSIEIAETLERTPRGKTPLVIHRAPVQDLLRSNGVEPSSTYAA